MATFNLEDAIVIGEEIGIDWDEAEFTPESFLKGLEVELEHGTKKGEETNVTDDEPFVTGQITWVHLLEDPDYYELLDEMEKGFDGVKTEASTRRIKDPRRYAYVLDEIVEKNPDYISPEIGQMAKKFIEQSKKSAKSLADDDDKEFLGFLEDSILAGPQLGNVASGDLVELLIGAPIMGAIPLADLRAENLLRGDKIDVYDYLQAALQHMVERVALMWLKGEQLGAKVRQHEEELGKQQQQDRGNDTMVQVPKSKKPQEMGASVRRFATVRIDGQEY